MNKENKNVEQLEKLKVEYFKLKNQLDSTIEQYTNLKNRVEMEVKEPTFKNKTMGDVNPIKEKMISSTIAYGLFGLCFILGYVFFFVYFGDKIFIFTITLF